MPPNLPHMNLNMAHSIPGTPVPGTATPLSPPSIPGTPLPVPGTLPEPPACPAPEPPACPPSHLLNAGMPPGARNCGGKGGGGGAGAGPTPVFAGRVTCNCRGWLPMLAICNIAVAQITFNRLSEIAAGTSTKQMQAR